MLTKQETLLEEDTRAESSRVRKPRRAALPRGSVSGFMLIGLVSGLSSDNHSDSESFLVAHESLISSVVLTRTSYHKMTHVNGY